MAELRRCRSQILHCLAAPASLQTRQQVAPYSRISTLVRWAFLITNPIMIGAMSMSPKIRVKYRSTALVAGLASPTNIGWVHLFPTRKQLCRQSSGPAVMSTKRKLYPRVIPMSLLVPRWRPIRVFSPAPRKWLFWIAIQRNWASLISITPSIGDGSGSSPFRSSGSSTGCSACSAILASLLSA